MKIDIHEKELASLLGVPPVPLRCDILAGEYAIERKTFADFVNSLKSGRFKSQVSRLPEYGKPAVIVELDNTAFFDNAIFRIVKRPRKNLLVAVPYKINPLSPLNALNALYERNTRVILSPNMEGTATIVRNLDTRGTVVSSEASGIPRKTREEMIARMLTSLPGIGVKRARQIMEFAKERNMTLIQLLEFLAKGGVAGKTGEKIANFLNQRV